MGRFPKSEAPEYSADQKALKAQVDAELKSKRTVTKAELQEQKDLFSYRVLYYKNHGLPVDQADLYVVRDWMRDEVISRTQGPSGDQFNVESALDKVLKLKRTPDVG